jgi:hypothetical protein
MTGTLVVLLHPLDNALATEAPAIADLPTRDYSSGGLKPDGDGMNAKKCCNFSGVENVIRTSCFVFHANFLWQAICAKAISLMHESMLLEPPLQGHQENA